METLRAALRSISPKLVQRYDKEHTAYRQYRSQVLDGQPDAVVNDIVEQIEDDGEIVDGETEKRFVAHITDVDESIMTLVSSDDNRSVAAQFAQRLLYAKIRRLIGRKLTRGGVWTRGQAQVWDAHPENIRWIIRQDSYDIQVAVTVVLRSVC